MAVDKPIGFTPDPPPFPEETEQMAQNVVDIQVEEANPNVEMNGRWLSCNRRTRIINTYNI